ncbi:MAG: MBOAT family protein [Desulfovibrionaceae bacterium]
MLFNSFQYILLFLPLAVAGYFLLARCPSLLPVRLWLLGCSLFFYGWWTPKNLPLILGSIAVNYLAARLMGRGGSRDRGLLALGLLFDIFLLGYFKYRNFFMENLAVLVGDSFTAPRLVLPLAISFFTLQQIAFLVDVREGRARPGDLLDYATFVAFFPQLIAGPIVHHSEIMPQLADPATKRPDFGNMARGLTYFAIGLFKKVVVADTFARVADAGFAAPAGLSAVESLAAILSYTFQLYYDFGGYMDMAIGAALLFNIRLPINFDSPFKSRDIIEFWRRWHITLSNFITAYIYTPLVRSLGRFTLGKSLLGIGVTMLVAGLWHGAAWTFIIFGGIHGAALIVNHLWRRRGVRLPGLVGQVLTFAVTVVSLCFFRAPSAGGACVMLGDLAGGHGLFPSLTPAAGPAGLLAGLAESALFHGMGGFDLLTGTLVAAAAGVWTFTMPNSHQMVGPNFAPSRGRLLLTTACLVIGLVYINSFPEKVFLYFDF